MQGVVSVVAVQVQGEVQAEVEEMLVVVLAILAETMVLAILAEMLVLAILAEISTLKANSWE